MKMILMSFKPTDRPNRKPWIKDGKVTDYYGVADQVFWFKLIIHSDKTDQSFRLGWPII